MISVLFVMEDRHSVEGSFFHIECSTRIYASKDSRLFPFSSNIVYITTKMKLVSLKNPELTIAP